DFFREALADRALQVAELDQRHPRLRVAEDHPVLRQPLQLAADLANVLQAGVSTAGLAAAEDDQDGDRDDRQEGDRAADLQQPLAPLLARALAFAPEALLLPFLPGAPAAHAGLPT